MQDKIILVKEHIHGILILSIILILLCSSVQALEIERDPFWENQDPDWTSKIQLADIDNDGYLDLVTANFIRGKGYTKNNTASIKLYKNIGGIFERVPSQIINMEKNVGSWNIALGDYDNDGDLDLAVGNIFEKKDLIFKNNQGVFEKRPVWESDDASVSHGLDWVDYDQDGDLDLSVSAAYSGAKIYENIYGKISTHAKWESYEALDYQDLDWIDMDNDGDFDLAVANHNDRPPGGIFIYKSTKGELPSFRKWVPGKFKKYLPLIGLPLIKTVSWKTHTIKVPGRLAWGDINGDGFPELATTNGNGHTMVFSNVEGNLQEAPYWESSDSDNSFDLLFADVDNDGLVNDSILLTGSKIKKVIYLSHSPAHSIESVFVNSEKILRKDYCYDLKDGWLSFNHLVLITAKQIRIEYTYSNDLDLVVAKSTWQGNPEDGKTDKIYLNEKGVLSRKADWQTKNKTLSNAVAVGDVDNDGDLDIVFGGEVGWEAKTKVPQHIYLYLNRTVK